MKQNLNDPVIDEIRDVRHRISARFGHDPAQVGALLPGDAEAVPGSTD